MMRCVLNGTPLTSSKCKASLKKLVKKKLTKATESVRGCRKVAEKKAAEKKNKKAAEKKAAIALQIYHRTREMKKKAVEKVAKLKRSNEKKKKERNIKRK